MLNTVGNEVITVIQDDDAFKIIHHAPDDMAGLEHDSFGVNIARAKLNLDYMIEVWRSPEPNSWGCGRQDHYGDQMDFLARFCGYEGYWERGR